MKQFYCSLFHDGLGIDDKLRSKNGTTVRYFLTDHLGSTVALTDASGAIVSSTSYDSFGNATSNIATTYRYTGREYDPETGLYYYRNRWYDPEIGRFTSKDPIGFAGGDINLYGYVGNSPLNFTDPLGNYPCSSQKGKKQKKKRQSKDELAKEWLRRWNPISIEQGIEHGSKLCMSLKTGKISSASTVKGKVASVRLPECPEGTVSVARLHTHGGPHPRYKDEVFSDDKKIANKSSLRAGHTVYSYLGTPKGKFLKFIPASIKDSKRGKVVKLRP